MKSKITLDDITIRTELQPGDIGQVIHLHGVLYGKEYNYGISFESYVAKGLYEFYNQFDSSNDRVWIAEYNNEMVGFLLLMHRENKTAQLRYFLTTPNVRGIGLGKYMMKLFMEFFYEKKYNASYLWTTNELFAAASLYKRHGFELTEEKDSTYFGKPLKEQRYDLKIQNEFV